MIRALANAEHISILADKSYYNLVRHENEHLTHTPRTIKNDFSIILDSLMNIEYGCKDIKSKKKLFGNFMSTIFDFFIVSAKQKTISKKDVIEYFSDVKHLVSTNKLRVDVEEWSIYNEHKDICRLFVEGDMEKLYDFIANAKAS
jgi:hypothetical protein